MTLVDLARITDALLATIQQGVASSSAWAPNPPPAVEAVPPESMAGEGLCLHLYSVGRNNLAMNRQGDPVGNPLGLDLHYQLTAHGANNPPTTASVRREQLMLGLAMKTLHENSRLEAGLSVGGLDIFSSAGLSDDNSLTIELMMLEPDQTVGWWTASPASVRAAAYYQVSVALLQETPSNISGPPVLVREVFGFAGLAPHLSSTRSRHTVNRPGHDPSDVVSAPATVEPGGGFEIVGHGFGPQPIVTVRADGWGNPEQLPGASVRLVAGVETILATVDDRVGGRLLVPGMLRVAVVRTEDRLLHDGTTRTFEHVSNETAVSVIPSVSGVAPPAGAGQPYSIDGGPFLAAGIDPDTVRLLVNGDELAQVGTAPSPSEFQVVDGSTIEFSPPTPHPPSEVVRLRLMINGAENLPFWYVAP